MFKDEFCRQIFPAFVPAPCSTSNSGHDDEFNGGELKNHWLMETSGKASAESFIVYHLFLVDALREVVKNKLKKFITVGTVRQELERIGGVPQDLIEFIEYLLVIDHTKRPTARDALRHPYLADVVA